MNGRKRITRYKKNLIVAISSHFQVPDGISDSAWKVLSDSDTPVPALVQTVTHIVAALLKNLQDESEQISLIHSQSSPDKSSPDKSSANQISPTGKQKSPGTRQSNVTFGNLPVSPTSTKPSLTSMKTLIL